MTAATNGSRRPGETPASDVAADTLLGLILDGGMSYGEAEFILARPKAGRHYERIDAALSDAAERLARAHERVTRAEISAEGRDPDAWQPPSTSARKPPPRFRAPGRGF